MIFEKLIEIAKYYDWESIFRGSLNLYEKFTDIKYLKKYNIELSEADITEINNGGLPLSLLNEKGTYLNDKGFDLVGRMVYDKLVELGYITLTK